jgi:hypothetical protein
MSLSHPLIQMSLRDGVRLEIQGDQFKLISVIRAGFCGSTPMRPCASNSPMEMNGYCSRGRWSS